MDELEKIKGIKQDKKTGHFYVRLNCNGIRYAPVNYTKKYGCKTLEETQKKVIAIKNQIYRGEDPFDVRTFDEHMRKYLSKLKPNTAYIYDKVYQKYAKPIIGNKLPKDIIKKDIEYIYEDMADSKKVNSKDTFLKMKGILAPTFTKLFKEGLIDKNVLLLAELPKLSESYDIKLSPLNMRLNDESLIAVVRKLYHGILKIEDESIRYYLLLILMTARRRGEAFKTHKEDITRDVVFAKTTITKTKIDERYILPEEIVEYLNRVDKEYPFKVPTTKMNQEWKEMLQAEEISYRQSFRMHDLRHLFQSIMSKKYNRDLVGACISHHAGDINAVYQAFEFEDRKEVFRDYWRQIREPIVENENL